MWLERLTFFKTYFLAEYQVYPEAARKKGTNSLKETKRTECCKIKIKEKICEIAPRELFQILYMQSRDR